MQKLISILSSRTNWVIAVGLLVNVTQFLQPFLSPELFILINSILAALGVYFRSNPRVDF